MSENAKPLVYALDSLPALIGERQFMMLLRALEMRHLEWDAREDGVDAVGPAFAAAIEHKARTVLEKREEARRQCDDTLISLRDAIQPSAQQASA